MKHIEKKISKNQLLFIILGSVLALLLAGVIITVAVMNKEPEVTEQPSIQLLPGESSLYNSPIAYESFDVGNISVISVRNKGGSYDLVRPSKGYEFILRYYDSDGVAHTYYPPITEEDTAFSYSDLLAIESGTSFGSLTKLTYLTIALTAPYFAERVVLDEIEGDDEEKLAAYGLTDDKATKIYFSYTVKEKNEEGKEVEATREITLKVGSQTVFESGYYFMVEGRNYVYTSTSNYFGYGLAGFASFIKPTLVAEGLDIDEGFEPYLTPGYYQWENTVVNGYTGEKEDQRVDEFVSKDSTVIVYADTISSIKPSSESKDEDGYIRAGYDLIEIDLAELAKSKDENYKRAVKALIGRQLGDYIDYSNTKIVFTTTASNLSIDFGEKESLSYEYTVTGIEAIITDSTDITEKGYSVGENNLVKVEYYLSIEGERVSEHPSHAVIDLSVGIPAEAAAALREAEIGTLEENIVFTVEYTKDNANKILGETVITEIVTILDQEEQEISTVTKDSIVVYTYCYMVNGEKSYESTNYVNLAELPVTEFALKLKELLIGQKVSDGLELSLEKSDVYTEYFNTFTTYEISRIDYCVEKELVVAFKFANASDRDPYYGESLYENIMSGSKSLYGLNYDACESVVRLLGGIDPDGESGTAAGLEGDKVYAVGLTPEIMKEYGLWAYTIYFELPRVIISYEADEIEGDKTSTESLLESLEDYRYTSTIGFTLYISEADPKDGSRYVACDLYDIVTKVDADTFAFLDYDFESFWARRSIILMDITYLTSMSIEFNMADVKGSYDLKLNHRTAYVFSNAIYYTKPDVSGYTERDEITVVVTPNFEKAYTDTGINKFIKDNNYTFVSLTEYYNALYGEDVDELKAAYPDPIGTAYFKEAIQTLYLTRLVGTLTEEEQQRALESEALLRIKVGTSFRETKYAYEFYRLDDRRVMVRIYNEGPDGRASGSVSDFYISTFAFKKIVSSYQGVLNGERIDSSVGYPDMKED